jgi:hypothetical protein
MRVLDTAERDSAHQFYRDAVPEVPSSVHSGPEDGSRLTNEWGSVMTPKHLAISLTMLVLVLPIQGQKPPVPQPDQGRYQLLAVPLDETYPASIGSPNSRRTSSQQLFLFDSQTGRVWHYRPESFEGSAPNATFTPEAFIPVPIWNPTDKQKVFPDSN